LLVRLPGVPVPDGINVGSFWLTARFCGSVNDAFAQRAWAFRC